MGKVNKTSSCWLWTGAVRNGYGCLKVDGKLQSAHRISFSLFNGVIPAKCLVCHSCDVRLCVNPKHLFVGTHRDNVVDAIRKGRVVIPIGSQFLKGEQHRQHILSKSDVNNIRIEYANSTISMRKLAKKYGVDHSNIWQIVRSKGWV